MKAADLMAPSVVELVNPDLHLATLTQENAHLVMELVAEQGRGYRPAETSEVDRTGMLALDAIFTPIQRVKTTIENTRVGQMTTYEKLTLELWTDGTIDPDEALRQAGDILVREFTPLLMGSGAHAAPPAVEPMLPVERTVQIPPEIARQSIEDLDLSVRTYNALKRNGIITLGTLLEMTEEELRALRNVGERSLRELQERLVEHDALPRTLTTDTQLEED